MPKKKDIWKQIIKVLQSVHGKAEIEPWFFGSRLQSINQNKAIIEAPNRFVAIWLKDHFTEDLQNAFAEVCGYHPQITYSYPNLPCITTGNSGPEHIDSWDQILHPFIPEYSFDSFVLDNSNRFAHAAAMSIADAQTPTSTTPLVIFSSITCGKTHLLHAIGNRIKQRNPEARAAYLNANKLLGILGQDHREGLVGDLTNCVLLLDILILDDIHLLSGNHKAQAILHSICDTFQLNNKPMAFASAESPTSTKDMDPHLSSRLQSGILAEIPKVEQETRSKIVRNRLAKQSVSVTDDIVFYLVNLTTDVGELLSYSDEISKYATNNTKPIELSHVKRLVGLGRHKDINIRNIQDSVARFYGVDSSQLRSQSRQRQVCCCRHVAMYLCKEILGCRLQEIGEAFGKMTHSSVLYALRKIRKDIENNETVAQEVEELKKIITYC